MDDQDLNEDWIKTRSWDLGQWDDFLHYLGVSMGTKEQQRAAVEHFKNLPAWQAAPPGIKARARALGVSG